MSSLPRDGNKGPHFPTQLFTEINGEERSRNDEGSISFSLPVAPNKSCGCPALPRAHERGEAQVRRISALDATCQSIWRYMIDDPQGSDNINLGVMFSRQVSWWTRVIGYPVASSWMMHNDQVCGVTGSSFRSTPFFLASREPYQTL